MAKNFVVRIKYGINYLIRKLENNQVLAKVNAENLQARVSHGLYISTQDEMPGDADITDVHYKFSLL